MPPNPALNIHGQPREYNFLALEDTSTTALVKNGSGFFHALVVTGGTAGTVSLFDNTEASGTVVASFGLEGIAQSGLEGSVKAESFLFDTTFQTGLVVSTTAVDTPRLSISFR